MTSLPGMTDLLQQKIIYTNVSSALSRGKAETTRKAAEAGIDFKFGAYINNQFYLDMSQDVAQASGDEPAIQPLLWSLRDIMPSSNNWVKGTGWIDTKHLVSKTSRIKTNQLDLPVPAIRDRLYSLGCHAVPKDVIGILDGDALAS